MKRSSSDTSRSGTSDKTVESDSDTQKFRVDPNSPAFFNALVGRIFFDFFNSPDWTIKIQNMIQKKLDSIKRPKFIDALVVRDVCLGNVMPVIQRVSSPVIDTQGLWVDLDLTYEGNFALTIETKLNLVNSPTDQSHGHDNDTESKFTDGDDSGDNIDKESISSVETQAHERHSSRNSSSSGIGIRIDPETEHIAATPAGNMYDSDAYDSGESSEDEDDEDFDVDDFLSKPSNKKRSKGSRMYQSAKKSITAFFKPEMTSIRRAITNATDTPLILSVEVTSGVGTLALNIPPPPNDRIWYGFRTNPNIQLVVKPKLGDMKVNLTRLTDWISKKLLHEMERVLVLPNMDDMAIPLMEFKLPTV